MSAFFRGFALAGVRLLAFLANKKLIVFQIEPREEGYSFIRSSDLPGFTMLLEPGEADDIQSLIDALSAPIKAYMEALQRHQPNAVSHRPVLKLWAKSDN